MALIVRNLSKRFGEQPALQNVQFDLLNGVVALLGVNGSGKSTLLRVLATLCKPDSGEISFNGLAYGKHQRPLRSHIGYLPQSLEMPDGLTPFKFLSHLAQLRGGNIKQVPAVLGLNTFLNKPFHQLSDGQIRLVGIAQALLGTPQLLLLDEPSRNLDVIQRRAVFRSIQGRAGLVIFSTHIMEEADELAEKVIILRKGRILFYGEVQALRLAAAGKVYELCLPTQTFNPQQLQRQGAYISRVSSQGEQTVIRFISEKDHSQAVHIEPSLEDSYLWFMHYSGQQES
jgi:ABC-2 type transport system ATP-binding protein